MHTDQSIFQQDSEKYYNCVRKIHSSIFCNNKRRKKSELNSTRYICDNKKIKNLFSLVDVMRTALPKIKKIKGIDLGCGNHYFIEHTVNNYGWDVYGYDIDNLAISLARKYYPEQAYRYIQHDLVGNGIPIEDNKLDFIFCNALIQHLSKIECSKLFKEAKRVLADNGIFLIIFKKPFCDKVGVYESNTSPDTKFIDPEVAKIINSGSNNKLKNNYYESIPNINLYSLYDVLQIAQKIGFSIDNSISDYSFEYYSGKGFLTGAVIIKKTGEYYNA